MDRLSISGDSGRTLVLPIAAFLILLGAFVLLGWAAGSAAMVRILPSSVAMGFNAAAAFVVVGFVLLSRQRVGPAWRHLRLGLATALIVLFSIILIEHWLDTSLGVDWVRLHQTVADNNPRPGRVAPNTSLAFLLTGLVFLLLEGRRTIRARGARFFTYVIFAIGIAGLLGYVLELEWLYQWYRFNRMALPTAIGVCAMAIALLLTIRAADHRSTTDLRDVDKKIVARSTAILGLLAAAFAISGFALMRTGVEEVMRQNLMQAAKNTRQLFQTSLEQHLRMAKAVSNRPGLLQNMAALQAHPDDTKARENIVAVQQSFLPLGFTRLDLYDAKGQPITAPRTDAVSTLSVPLTTQPFHSELVWKDTYLLRNRIPLSWRDQVIGFAITEQPITALSNSASHLPGAGATDEFRLCVRAAERLRCFPSRLDRSVLDVPFFKQGKPSFPVARAILGEEGVTSVADYRRHPVLAAYVTIEANRLGLVMKQDIEELFQPLRQRLAALIGLIAVLVFASAYILRSSIRPLAAQLLNAETEARKNAAALGVSMNALKQSTDDLRASETEVRTLNSELEQRVNVRTAELTRANEDLNQFAYAASHDLQEPLRNVSLYSQLMARRYSGKLDKDADTYLGFISQSAQRMQQLLRDVLNYTQVATGVSEPMEQPLDAQLGLDAALENLHAAILESGAEITHDKLPAVYLYQAHLVQLFQNLIGNAIKYRSETALKVHIGARKQGDSWLFSVKDNGIGIEPQYAEKIFGVFKRLHKEAYPGTGIGLAICQKIVHRYRGHIWAESELGKGTTFFFTLPGAPLPSYDAS